MTWLVSKDVLARTEYLETPFNRHGIDEFGVSRVEIARMMTVFGWFYHKYFRVIVQGIEQVPIRGRGIVVGNHSGGVAIDGMMMLASMFFDKEPPRLVHGMAEKFMSRIPFASLSSARTGNFAGTPEIATTLLERERLLMVFPEGARGTAKLYSQRNTLVNFGTGFMRLALQTGAPIIPFACIGGGAAMPTMVNLYRLGKIFGLPYIPVTPYLLPIPRPVTLQLYYGEPMHFEGSGNEEDNVVNDYVAQVRDRIAAMIESGQQERISQGWGQ